MASSCSYKAVDGGDGDACVLAPRSCRECLNEPLPSGEVCAVSPLSGLCLSASAVTSATPLFSGVETATEPLLSNATVYCDAGDAECASCLAQTHSSGAVCLGTLGCVCVGICERDADAWRETTTLLLSQLLSGSQTAISGNYSNDSSSSSNTSDCLLPTSESEVALPKPSPPAKSTFASDNECMWHPDDQDQCARPRSCYACLNVPLPSGQECTITPQGYCSTIDAYEPARDFRLNGSDSAPHYFPSRNTTYCEPTDATCSACARGPFVLSDSGRIHASQFCVGAGGCVCVGFCESPDYDELVMTRMCDAVITAETSASNSDKSMHLMASAIVLSALVLVSLSLWLWRKARAEARMRPTDRSRDPREPQFGPPLALTAWKAQRDELVARETAETLGAPSYDSAGCFYLTPPSATPTALMAERDADDLQIATSFNVSPTT